MVFIIAHIVLCVVYRLIRHLPFFEKANTFPAVMVYVLPFFGFLMWMTESLMIGSGRQDEKSVAMEKLKVTDAKYRRFSTDISENDSVMVPLEDALVINEPKLRRLLLLDILRKNPEEYLNILERAKASDDVEVTHYATTTLLEIQSQFEQRLQEYQSEYPMNKKDRDFLLEYSACLKQYADSGLIDGTVLTMQQETLLDVVSAMMKLKSTNREDAFLYVETALNLKKYEDAKRVLDKISSEREESEVWNRLAVRYYWEMGQTEEKDKILEEIANSNMYLTKEGKEWFYFWSKGKSYEKN